MLLHGKAIQALLLQKSPCYQPSGICMVATSLGIDPMN